MGFPFDEKTWDVVEGAMYMGAGGGMPGTFTWISIAVCVVLLVIGNMHEHKMYAEYK